MILMAKMLAKLLGKIGPTATAHGPVVRLFDLQFGCCKRTTSISKRTTSISPIRSASSHHRFIAIHSSPWSNCPTVPLSNCPTCPTSFFSYCASVLMRGHPIQVFFFCKLMPLCCTVLLCRTQLTQRLRLNSLMVSNSHNDRM